MWEKRRRCGVAATQLQRAFVITDYLTGARPAEEEMRLFEAVCCVSLLTLTTMAFGQTLERGDIHGIVYDPAQAVVGNANVTLSSAFTGFQRTVKSDNAGVYQFLQVPPG